MSDQRTNWAEVIGTVTGIGILTGIGAVGVLLVFVMLFGVVLVPAFVVGRHYGFDWGAFTFFVMMAIIRRRSCNCCKRPAE